MKLVEILAAAAVGALLVWALLRAAGALASAGIHLDARLNGSRALGRLSERLESDAATAWSISVPATDLLGSPNRDGHEVDFAAQDAARNRYRWAYLYDSSAQRVTLYAESVNGAVASDVFTGVSGFVAEAHAIGDLGDPSSDLYDPLLAGSGAVDVTYRFGWSPVDAVGGNALTRIAIGATGERRTLVLASATAPSRYHVIVDYTPGPASP